MTPGFKFKPNFKHFVSIIKTALDLAVRSLSDAFKSCLDKYILWDNTMSCSGSEICDAIRKICGLVHTWYNKAYFTFLGSMRC